MNTVEIAAVGQGQRFGAATVRHAGGEPHHAAYRTRFVHRKIIQRVLDRENVGHFVEGDAKSLRREKRSQRRHEGRRTVVAQRDRVTVCDAVCGERQETVRLVDVVQTIRGVELRHTESTTDGAGRDDD